MQSAHKRYMDVWGGEGTATAEAAIKASEKEMVKFKKVQREFGDCRDRHYARMEGELKPIGASADAAQAAWAEWRQRNFPKGGQP